jgi:hypothetical protein
MHTKASGGMDKNNEPFKQYSEIIMHNQPTTSSNMSKKNKPHKTPKTRVPAKNAKKWSSLFAINLNKRTNADPATSNGFELFTRFAYCQALLYKAWVEASDKVANEMTRVGEQDNKDSNVISLYVDTFEDVFTNLFRSPEFSLNASKLLNSLMEYSKNGDDIAKILGSYKMTEISKNRNDAANDIK